MATLLIRVPYVYGTGDDRPGIINTLARKALAGQDIATHFYRNGAPAMQLLHVRDLAQVLRSAACNNWTGVVHLPGETIFTDELARRIIRLAGSESRHCYVELPGEYHKIRLGTNRVVSWRPEIALDRALTEIISCLRTTPLREAS